MSRTAAASLITACLLLAGCAGAVDPSPLPAAPAPPTPTPAATVPAVLSGPDPAAIVEIPQPVVGAPPTSAAIPGIGNVPIVGVGIAPDGQAEIPEDVSTVGWYSYGSAPGDGDGSVVLMGHRDSKGGKGALWTLPNVAVGSTITVTDAAGVAHSYEVTSNESISKQVVPLSDLFVRNGPPQLVIISCGGDYVKELGGYLDNVVLTAQLRG